MFLKTCSKPYFRRKSFLLNENECSFIFFMDYEKDIYNFIRNCNLFFYIYLLMFIWGFIHVRLSEKIFSNCEIFYYNKWIFTSIQRKHHNLKLKKEKNKVKPKMLEVKSKEMLKRNHITYFTFILVIRTYLLQDQHILCLWFTFRYLFGVNSYDSDAVRRSLPIIID